MADLGRGIAVVGIWASVTWAVVNSHPLVAFAYIVAALATFFVYHDTNK